MKKKRSILKSSKISFLRILLGACSVFIISSCEDSIDNEIATEKIILKGLQINTTEELPLLIGRDSSLNITISPDSPTNGVLEWTSDNEEIATVSSDGNVKAVALGTAKITVKSTDGGARAASIIVKVISSIDYITAITLTAGSPELFEDEVLALNAAILPSNATYKTLKWTSSDPSIAKVSETGEVTGIKPGSVTITASSIDGSGKSGIINLTVKKVIPLTAIAISTVVSETLAIDQLLPIQVVLSPSDATAQSLEWSTNSAAIATVSNTGVVTGVGDGRVVITVSAKNDPDIKASIELVVEAGKINDTFIDGVIPRWTTSTSGASVLVQDNKLMVTMNTGTNRRGDFRRPNTTLHIGNYPIIAFKFVRPLPTGGNVFLDTNQGRWRNGANNMTRLEGNDGIQVLYADLGSFNSFGATGFALPTTSAYTFTQLTVGVADMPTAQNPISPYPVYWIKTFKTIADLQAYINQ